MSSLLLSSLFPYAVWLFDIEKLTNRVYVKSGDEANPERELLPFDHGVRGGGGGGEGLTITHKLTPQHFKKNAKT
jgi:hypothetical protein